MRIIGGTYKGKTIAVNARLSLRPTTDFAKEGLFNILSGRYEPAASEVLDLFSGTGSISYEFVSRGARNVLAVEMNPQHVGFIRQTVRTMHIENIRIVRDDVFHFLTICKATYDVIFADPPYDMHRLPFLPDEILHRPLLNDNGILIVEHSRRTDFSGHQRLIMHRNYGNVHFSFFR
ncbi:MAG: RsmD family RNA methyltransferase [Bacteroidales bacterium]|jgi:16S rRNA (guanine(966)-N(2))-methyltransferase RsmD|nr:RsmD family RNA methyltransferase [Bacteroidales bacterium]